MSSRFWSWCQRTLFFSFSVWNFVHSLVFLWSVSATILICKPVPSGFDLKASPNCHSIQILVLTPQGYAGSWFKPYTLISNLAVVMALIWYRLEGGVRRLLSKPIHAKEAGNSLPLFYSRVQTRLHLLGEPPVILKDIARKLMTSWSWSLTLQIIGSSIHTEEFACRSWLPAVLSPIDGICDGICDDIAQTFFVFLDWANSLP